MRSLSAIVIVISITSVIQAANPATPTNTNSTATTLSPAERQARIDLTLAQTKLDLILARKALKTRDLKDAGLKAKQILQSLGQLPPDIDTDEYELQAEGILARVAQAGVDVDLLGSSPTAQQNSNQYGYSTGGRIVETAHQSETRAYYGDSVYQTYSADADRLLREADEARLVPPSDVSYPADWPEKVASRAKYAGGEIARSEGWIDEDGNEWYAAIYDIRDLTYIPPDFMPTFSIDPAENLRNALDRHALRWGNGFFNGISPWDLSSTLPLFRAFGGIDDYIWRGPKYSAERQEQIVQMIEAFNSREKESKIISLEP